MKPPPPAGAAVFDSEEEEDPNLKPPDDALKNCYSVSYQKLFKLTNESMNPVRE